MEWYACLECGLVWSVPRPVRKCGCTSGWWTRLSDGEAQAQRMIDSHRQLELDQLELLGCEKKRRIDEIQDEEAEDPETSGGLPPT